MDYKNMTRAQIDEMMNELARERMRRNEQDLPSDSNLKETLENAIAKTPAALPETAVVACQGADGSNAAAAAARIIKYPQIVHMKNFEGVFQAIDSGLCEYGVLPVENSYAGSINDVYDLLIKHKCYIVRSVKVRIDHCLMVKAGHEMSEVKEIVSHEQGLLQSSEYLKKHYPDIKQEACGNTAMAAIEVAESDGSKAAVCAPQCEEMYGLKTVAKGIQNNPSNYTRFICIAKTPQIYPGADKTSIRVKTEHKPGGLLKVIEAIVHNGYNMTKLESRPIPNTDFDFSFYFDFETPVIDDKFISALCEIEAACLEMEYLGSYKEKL
ncbi:MAG: prephenate dehydratase [Firmicutes bacterium]|nr:prephenate dehydratase [Bacillota bacterium]